MKRLILLIAGFWAMNLAAQTVIPSGKTTVTQLQERDSILIADQLEYGFVMEDAPKGAEFAFPDFSKGFMDSVEVVREWKVDSLLSFAERRSLAKGKDVKVNIKASIVIAAFEEGVYELPPLAVQRTLDGIVDTLVFDPQTIDVKTMPVDTATFEIHDIKGQIRYPLTPAEIIPYLAGTYIFAGIVIAIVCLLLMKKRKGEESVSTDPPYIVALRGLEKFRGDRYWAPEKQKLMYSGITDTLRTYMESRFGVNAEGMTTAEIFDALKTSDSFTPELYAELKALFELSDYVKFAKHTAGDEENARAIPTAVRFVTATYQTEVQASDTEDKKDGGEAADN